VLQDARAVSGDGAHGLRQEHHAGGLLDVITRKSAATL
jgi:hypothetical protein